MRIKTLRGSSLVELAVVVPLVVFLIVGFFQWGQLFLRQLQLERLAQILVRELAASSDQNPTTGDAHEWLLLHHQPHIEPLVQIRTLLTPPRGAQRNRAPLRIVVLILSEPWKNRWILKAESREVML